MVQEQTRRVKEQNRRFNLGRVSVNDLAQAEDDLARWELSSQQKSIEVRNIAWEVQKLSGELFAQLESHIKQRFKAAKEAL